MACLTGCYSLQPVGGATPQLGTQVAFDVTDAGRVALGGSMGPEIGQVEGRLVERDNGEYLLRVTSVSLLRGGVQTWAGEQVRFKPEYVGTIYQKRFSPGRTIAVAAIGAGAVALMVSQGLLGSGAEDGPTQPSDSSQLNRKFPRTFRIPLGSVNISRFPLIGRP
jgi:hypothetical protein